MKRSLKSAFLVIGLSPTLALAASESASTLQDQQSVAVTIYNENLALIKDIRRIHIDNGTSELAYRDVSASIRPETALLRSLTSPGKLNVREQNFDFDLLTPQKLLEKYVGKTVSLVRTNPTSGSDVTEPALVLAATSGVVLRVGERIETGMPGRIVYPDVPSNLRERPTLVMSLNNQGATEQEVELSYLTGGLSWKADYVAELNAADDRLDLSGWVTLTNTSGTSYRNARLQLVAGDVNLIRQGTPAPVDAPRKARLRVEEASTAGMAEESLFEYHLYSLDRSTTIAENQSKQVSLLNASGVSVKKELQLQGSNYYYQSSHGNLGQRMKPVVFVEFDNKETVHLGMPLPKGTIRVYKKDSTGNAQFVGEDSIDHTPKNEKVRIKLGEAFDVTADKKQTDFKKLSGDSRYNYVFESAFEVQLKNAKKEAVTVSVQEPIPGDWKILKESHAHEQVTSNTAVWRITIPAEGRATLSYRAQVRY